jgi:hypothetical protein
MKGALEMSATFTPFLETGSPATTGDAYIRVRVTDEPRRDGSLLVYLRDGTALVVNGHLLLHLDPGPDCPEQSDGGTSAADARHSCTEASSGRGMNERRAG